MLNTLEISMKIGKILGLAEATKSILEYNTKYVEDTPMNVSMGHLRENMEEIIKAANEIDLYEK